MGARTPDYQSGQLIPGTVYRVHRVLGAGGMGTVYDVEDTSVGRRYVLKTLHGDLADRADLAARLSREARALAKLQHPNIVEVYTSGTTQDKLKLPFYVMERLQGQSLRTAIERKGRLTLEQAYDIAIDLLDALDHAHEFGIVHRDVKPDNIFITRGRDGRSLAKLLDFGIIKLAGSSTMHTGGRFIGTFRYAPPEQILGREVTAQSDLYSAALVLYEMIAGRGPFDDFAGEVEIGKAHIELPPPPVSRFAQVPPELDALILSALDKKLENRPKDAFTFASAIRELKRKLASRIGDVGQQATVEGVVSQVAPPSSGAATHHVTSGQLEPVSPGSGETRVDSPGAMLGPTQASPRSGTVDYGAAREPLFSTEAVGAPPVMTQGPGSAPVALVRPAPIDRNAETREAPPAVRFVPSNDTSPIPLSRPAEARIEQAPRAVETFGAHTSNPIARPAGRGASAVVLAACAVLAVVLGALGLFAWKRSHVAPVVAAPPPPVAVVTAVITPSPAETTSPSASASVGVPPTSASASPSVKVTPVATSKPSATVKSTGTSPSGTAPHATAPLPSAATAPTHRPGSGL